MQNSMRLPKSSLAFSSKISAQLRHPKAQPLLLPAQLLHLAIHRQADVAQFVAVQGGLTQDHHLGSSLARAHFGHKNAQVLKCIAQVYPTLAFHVIVHTALFQRLQVAVAAVACLVSSFVWRCWWSSETKQKFVL